MTYFSVDKYNDISNWGKDFFNDCQASNNRYLADRKFFGILNIPKIISCIEKSNTGNICYFRYGIGYIYDFENLNDYYKDDLPNLKSFREGLSKINNTAFGITKTFNIELLSKLLDKKISLIGANKKES